MLKMKKMLTALSLMFITTVTLADDAQIKAQLNKLGATDIEVKESPIKGMKTVVTNEGVLYTTEDGKYAIQGKLFELTDKSAVDVSGKALYSTLESYKDEMIVYPAKNEKYVVTIFMDITCAYCQKLHNEVKEYNDLGITLRYLAFPRGGLDTNTAKQMETIFTASDKAFALTEAQNGHLPKELKTPNIVKKHYKLGIQYGVRGTPSIITSSGELIGGYVPAKDLLRMLEG